MQPMHLNTRREHTQSEKQLISSFQKSRSLFFLFYITTLHPFSVVIIHSKIIPYGNEGDHGREKENRGRKQVARVRLVQSVAACHTWFKAIQLRTSRS